MEGDVLVDRILFEPRTLETYAARIFADTKHRAVRVHERGAGGRSIVFVARHKDAIRVLKEEQDFSLTHYGSLFAAVAPVHVRLLMAPRTAELTRQREIYVAAIRRMSNSALADAVASPREGFAKSRRAIARSAVQSLLDCFRAREEPQFDIVGEYGYFASYLIACEVFGLPGPARPDVLIRILALVRRWMGSFHRFTPETTPFLTAVYLAQFAFAQVLKNFENRTWYYRWGAWYGTSAFVRHIRARFDLALKGCDLYPASLLSILCEGAAGGPEGASRYADYAVSLLIEMFGTALLIPPTAFAGIIEWMAEQSGGIPVQLKSLDEGNARAFVDELLRLSPPSKYLLRTATKGVMFGDFRVNQGEYVCALVAQACRDPNVFLNPDTFDLNRIASDIPHFGPQGGPHQCLGRELGRDMLAEMLLGLKTLPGPSSSSGAQEVLWGPWPVDDAKMRSVLSFPQLMVTWNRGFPLKRAYGPHRSTAVGGSND